MTSSQIEEVSKYPDSIELKIGGKKVLLCHSINDYNTGELKINPNNYDEIFQGHTHFEEQNDNVTTVRGAGIGGKGESDGQAYYLVLTETEKGYIVEKNLIEYDIHSLKHDINLSDAPIDDKNKMNIWTGINNYSHKR